MLRASARVSQSKQVLFQGFGFGGYYSYYRASITTYAILGAPYYNYRSIYIYIYIYLFIYVYIYYIYVFLLFISLHLFVSPNPALIIKAPIVRAYGACRVEVSCQRLVCRRDDGNPLPVSLHHINLGVSLNPESNILNLETPTQTPKSR